VNVIFDADLLTPEQANGTACGVCGYDFEKERLTLDQPTRTSAPVGRTTDGRPIVACVETCLPRVAAFDAIFASETSDHTTLAIAYVEASNMDLLLDAFEHVIALKASGHPLPSGEDQTIGLRLTS
jgi:hypothetical protein